jgi:hypothetical protein
MNGLHTYNNKGDIEFYLLLGGVLMVIHSSVLLCGFMK